MFTGIIEALGTVKEIIINGSDKSFWIESPISQELKIDQSINHNGVCLTIEELRGKLYKITAVKETRSKTNLDTWEPGYLINLERSLALTGRLDGHFVQGHIDTTTRCLTRKEKKGSREFTFELPKKFACLVIEKGSIAINGISFTVFDIRKKRFKIAVIPFTFEHTTFKYLHPGDSVNLEFDVIGKYINRYLSLEDKLKIRSAKKK